MQGNKQNSKLNKLNLNITDHNYCYQSTFHARCNAKVAQSLRKNKDNINSRNFTDHRIRSTDYITKQFPMPSVIRTIINNAVIPARQAYV